jgi:hypothetical protein
VKYKAQGALFAVLLAVSGLNGGVLRQSTETLRTAANASAPPAASPQEKPPAKKHKLGPIGQQSLATVADVSADVQITRCLGVNAYYALAWSKSVISKIYPSEHDGQLAYVETNLRF